RQPLLRSRLKVYFLGRCDRSVRVTWHFLFVDPGNPALHEPVHDLVGEALLTDQVRNLCLAADRLHPLPAFPLASRPTEDRVALTKARKLRRQAQHPPGANSRLGTWRLRPRDNQTPFLQ